MEALSTIFPYLPYGFALPLIVVQHQHSTSDDFLARYLNERCNLEVKQANEKEDILPGAIYFAPPDYHLMIEEDKTFSLSMDTPVNFARPSIDVLFETAADVYGEKLVGVVLTGANTDGSQGLKKIKKLKGLAIVQDPETAEVDTMPKAAMAATEVDHMLSLDEIGPFITKLASLSSSFPVIKLNDQANGNI
jgi:two-component system chemotaxis response regulator CheB